MASRRLGDGLLLLMVVMISMPWPQSVGGMNLNLGEKVPPAGSSSRVLAALSYPSVRIGPYSWRYFRVEVPQAFAELSITLTRKWTGEHIGSYEGNVPMVCFRFGSPPLPDSVSLESPEEAAIAAAKAENLSENGKCAWFQSNSSIALTNMQIVAGVWYVGVFSDPQPSRFQSKMISRGNIFTFGIHFTVLGCKSPNLRGHNCSVAVKPLCSDTPTPGLSETANEAPKLFGQPTTKPGEGTWTSLKSQHVGPKEWKHFALEVDDFLLSLQVHVVCMSADCNKTSSVGLSGTTEGGMFYVKYGALPDAGDNGTAIGLAPISVSVPRRGLWYIGVHNENVTLGLDFDLHWHVESCSYGTTGDSCGAAVHFMDRVLVEDAQESPFNSFYGPTRKESMLSSPWFLLSEVTHLANTTSGNWTYFFIEVPRGAAGGVLSVQLRHVEEATMGVYARLEGLATPEHWDVKIMNVEVDKDRRTSPVEMKQEKQNKLSFDLVYPAEGIWCIGVHYAKRVASVNGIHSSTTQTPQLGTGRRISMSVIHLQRKVSAFILHWYQRLAKWLRTSWREFCSTVYSYNYSRALEKTPALANHITVSMEADIGLLVPKNVSEPSSSNQPLVELSSERQNSDKVQMHISMHGCVNKCSGKGHCSTSYESSRLHVISYCHCDAAHGGIDCSMSLLVPREETLHLWTLIGSNAAALLPSFWAIRHQAYSEWVSYVASGVSSGFYHSCDAGGWCVLSYDTLQFLDFWLSFVVVIMTCLSVASLKHDTKAVAHVATAIVTAAITKENATSAWNVLLVVLIGLAFLLLGWALECWRLRLIPSWLSVIGPIRPVLRMDSIYHRGEQLLNVIRARFQWFYLTAGLGFLFAAGLSWVLESADTYWIWHSFWHVSIYTSAFVMLHSTSKSSWASHEGNNREGYEPVSIQQQASDPEAAPMLRHAVELDAFATERNHRS